MISAMVSGWELPGPESSATRSPALNRFREALKVENRTGIELLSFEGAANTAGAVIAMTSKTMIDKSILFARKIREFIFTSKENNWNLIGVISPWQGSGTFYSLLPVFIVV
jgi:hypothetical protein